MPQVSVFVIDEHPVVIMGLQIFFRRNRKGVSVVGSSRTIESAREKTKHTSFDLFLVDPFVQWEDPLKYIGRLRTLYPFKPFIVYSGNEAVGWRKQMLKAGALDYLSKSMDRKKIMERITRATLIFRDNIKEKTIARDTVKSEMLDTLDITIVRHVLAGKRYQDISADIGRSISTIEKRLHVIRDSFEVRTNSELAFLFSSEQFLG